MKYFLLALTGSLALTATAGAQSFNLDVGANQAAPLPASNYGAAANLPGFWSPINTTLQGPVALKDLITDAVTSVTITPAGGYGDFYDNSQAWPGNDRLLMADASDVGNAGLPPTGGLITWTISNLAAGSYTLYTYGLAPDFPALYFTDVDVTGAPEGVQHLNGAWSGSPFVQGVTHAVHTITIGAGQNITVLTTNSSTTPASNYGSVNGFQIVRAPDAPGSPFCAGDGSGTLCPCGNQSPPANQAGCLNSLGLAGKLVATGSLSIANDTLVLGGSQMPDSSVLYFQGTATLGGGTVFGDGLRCAGGFVIRLGTKSNVGGVSQYPGVGDPSVSVTGLDAPGDTRTYQAWYRNSATFCTASTFNLTNGWQLTWAP